MTEDTAEAEGMGERRRCWNPRSAGGKVVSGRKGPILPATLGFATPALCCGATRRSTLDMGPDSPSWVRCRTRDEESLSLGPECLSLLSALMEGGRLNTDPRGASEELGLPSLYLIFNINFIYSWLCWVFVAMRAFP